MSFSNSLHICCISLCSVYVYLVCANKRDIVHVPVMSQTLTVFYGVHKPQQLVQLELSPNEVYAVVCMCVRNCSLLISCPEGTHSSYIILHATGSHRISNFSVLVVSQSPSCLSPCFHPLHILLKHINSLYFTA